MEITAVEIEHRDNPLLRGTVKSQTTIVTITLSDGRRMSVRTAHSASKKTGERRARALWAQYPQIFTPAEYLTHRCTL